MQYKCPWPNCGHEFEQNVGKVRYGHWRKPKHISSQVLCPICKNGLETWKGKIKNDDPPVQ